MCVRPARFPAIAEISISIRTLFRWRSLTSQLRSGAQSIAANLWNIGAQFFPGAGVDQLQHYVGEDHGSLPGAHEAGNSRGFLQRSESHRVWESKSHRGQFVAGPDHQHIQSSGNPIGGTAHILKKLVSLSSVRSVSLKEEPKRTVERRIRFGPFELDKQTGELWKNGAKVRLQGKPFQVLVALLERPGEPVSREELQQRLWSGDTFVDFESGLNTAANRLRLTLGDSADSPRYVETLARSGYRFVAKVEEIAQPAPAPVKAPEKPRSNWWIAAAIFAAVALAGVIWIVARRSAPGLPKFQQITYRRGPITGARFTP